MKVYELNIFQEKISSEPSFYEKIKSYLVIKFITDPIQNLYIDKFISSSFMQKTIYMSISTKINENFSNYILSNPKISLLIINYINYFLSLNTKEFNINEINAVIENLSSLLITTVC